MKISLNLIRQFVNQELDTDELVERIWQRVAEVEDVEDLGAKYHSVVIGVIKEAGAHPDADKLGLYKVDIGNEIVQVVAGDKSLNVDDRVGYIAPGVAVPSSVGTGDPFVIKKVNLRGQESNGMLGSGQELAINNNHQNVLKLDTDAPAGTSFAEIYDLNDVIVEIDNKSFVHRPDCFGLIGVAREIAGIQGIKFETPDWLLEEIPYLKSDNSLQVHATNEIPDQCPRYWATTIHGVDVKASPIKLQSYLSRIGIRPINNVVDITNYVMALTGQGAHAFDYDKVAKLSKDNKPSIVVRNPKKGERITLLDGRTIEPHEKAILICTDKEPIALGGAMGGVSTEVDNNTTKIILESANFNLYNIRKTSMVHGIFTEAVTRFIRGQSPQLCGVVGAKAASMIIESAGGSIGSRVIDLYEKPKSSKSVKCHLDFIRDRLGHTYSDKEIVNTLNNIEVNTKLTGKELVSEIPFWRGDLNIAEDLMEEVGRLNGYDLITASLPTRTIKPAKLPDKIKTQILIRDSLSSAGANEVLSFNFIPGKLLDNLGLSNKNNYHIRNSLSPELEFVRSNILPSLIEFIHPNIKQGFDNFALFEINKSHSKVEIDKEKLPIERNSLALVVAGTQEFALGQTEGSAFYSSKKYLNYVVGKLNLKCPEYKRLDEVKNLPQRFKDIEPMFLPGRTAAVYVAETCIAVLGEFSDRAIKAYKLPVYSAGFEMSLDEIGDLRSQKSVYKVLSKYPKIQQDATYKVATETKQSDIKLTLKESLMTQEITAKVCLKDIYQSKDDPTNKNLTYHITLQKADSTLTMNESNEIINSASEQLHKKFKAQKI